MSKGLENILSVYDEIFENKKPLTEASDIYDNVDFKDGVVGSSRPSQDNINTTLLADVQTAAKNAGVKVDITTAISGHRTGKTRHTSGNAVDIAIINGKPVSLSNRADTDKFVAELIKLGYVKNVETGNPKAVLTFGFPDHDNHVHISNTGGGSSTPTSSTPDSATPTPATPDSTSSVRNRDLSGEAPELLKKLQDFGRKIFPQQQKPGVTEQKEFGRESKDRGVRIVIPGKENPIIKAPYDGIINNSKYVPGCSQQLTLKLNSGYYLTYCGMDQRFATNGSDISKGERLGSASNDITVYLYDKGFSPVKYSDLKSKTTKVSKSEEPKRKSTTGKEESIYSALVQAPFRLFQDKYDKEGKRVEKRWGYSTDKEPTDPWIVNAVSEPFKKIGKFLGTNKSIDESLSREDKRLVENIQKIKRLIK